MTRGTGLSNRDQRPRHRVDLAQLCDGGNPSPLETIEVAIHGGRANRRLGIGRGTRYSSARTPIGRRPGRLFAPGRSPIITSSAPDLALSTEERHKNQGPDLMKLLCIALLAGASGGTRSVRASILVLLRESPRAHGLLGRHRHAGRGIRLCPRRGRRGAVLALTEHTHMLNATEWTQLERRSRTPTPERHLRGPAAQEFGRC